MSPPTSDAPGARMLALFQGAGIHFESVEDAWRRAEHLFPLLGWLTAGFPDERAFRTCAEWLRLCAVDMEEARPAAELFAQACSGAPRAGHVVAGGLGDLRNEWILARKPAAAAFADAAQHLCEVWAAVTTGDVDAEAEPWARAKAASRAMVTARLYQRGLEEDDAKERKGEVANLIRLLRMARASVWPEQP